LAQVIDIQELATALFIKDRLAQVLKYQALAEKVHQSNSVTPFIPPRARRILHTLE